MVQFRSSVPVPNPHIRFVASALLSLCLFYTAGAQDMSPEEMTEVFSGVHFDVEAAITQVEAKGITPYDFGRDLLQSGQGKKAIEWYQALAIATKEPQYVYGLAWVKWKTGDNAGALQDAYYLIKKDLPPIINARTLYLLGCINTDERQFAAAKRDLQAAFDAYADIPGKYGGQYLALTMMAWGAIHSENYTEVIPLLDRAQEYNEMLRGIGLEPYGLGYRHEIIGEMLFAQGNYQHALEATLESEAAYRASGELLEADEVRAKIGLLKLMTGNPLEAGKIATDLWERFHKSPDRERLLAYNSITLMKLSQCSRQESDRLIKEKDARMWASSSLGGQALIDLLEFVKEKVPCPEWR